MDLRLSELPRDLEVFEPAFREIIDIRLKATSLKDQAKELEEQANTLFQGIAEAHGVVSVESDIGTLRMIEKTNSKLDKDKVKDYLIKKGVDSSIVVDAFKKATKTSKSKYVGFFPKKGA